MTKLTPAQQALLVADVSTHAEACPGAGKTHAIIARFRERSSDDPRRGIALLSFTGAVVDEAVRRCSEETHLVRAPNYIGTLDSFINRFITGPCFRSAEGTIPRFYASWSQISNAAVSAKGAAGRFPLDWFRYSIEGTASLSLSSVPQDQRYLVTGLNPQVRKTLEWVAGKRWQSLVESGRLDSSTSRLLMTNYLADQQTRQQLATILSGRFFEIIVDEVQDCTDEEASLVAFLLEANIRIMTVGDPEQAIYGWRGETTGSLTKVLQGMEVAPRMNENWRSSTAITTLVSSLRATDEVDVSSGPNATVDLPVLLLSYKSESETTQKLQQLMSDYGFAQEDLVVLAHAGSKVRLVSGLGKEPKQSANKLVVLARSINTLQNLDASSRDRRYALECLGDDLREYATSETPGLEDDVFFAMIGLSERGYREVCLRLAMSLTPPFNHKPSEFKTDLLKCTGLLPLLGKIKLVSPNGDEWGDVHVAPSRESLKGSTIHAFKGLQAPCVALVIPASRRSASDDGLAQWSAGRAGEERNVLYVGASRAQKLVILVVHELVSDVVREVLERDHVPYANC